MKRSSPSLQFLATAATSAEASTRPPYRGARSQMPRRFSNQSSSSGGGGRGQIFTGDSHFLSASDANQGFRPVERTNYDNQIGYRSQARSPVYNPQSHFNPPPHCYTPPPIITPYFNPHPPSFNQNQCNRPPQQFRPRPPKSLGYRNWESAKLGPPPPCERFKVLSYNILADYLAMNHRSKLYFHIPEKMLEWEWRKKNIIFELGLWSADILCFQEVDKFQDLEEELKLRGYSGIWKMRTGVPVDGCAIFWRVSRFKLLHEECIEFNKLGLRDNVAQICVLESLNQNNNKDMSALPLSLTGSNIVVICNIHVLYNPKRGEIKLGQIRVLLDRAHAVSKLWDDAPVILSGDFNCTPKSPLYNYISEQKLNLSDLPRDKLSGQASAEIRPPKPFSPNTRPQTADSGGGTSVVVDHRELSQSGSPLDVQQQNSPERISVNLPSINSSSQPQCVKTGSNVYANNPSSGQHGCKNGTSSAEWTKGTHQEVDGYKDATPDGGLKESSSSSQNRVWVFVEQMKERHCENIYSNFIERELTKETHQDTGDGCNNEFHSMVSTSGLKDNAITQKEGEVPGAQREGGYEFTSVDSRHEDLIETEHKKQTYATVDAQCDTFIEQSERSLHTENKITSSGKSKLFFLSSYNTTDAITHPTPSGTSSSELFHETCLPSTMKVSTMGSSDSFSSLLPAKDKDNPSNLSKVNVSYELTSTDYMIDGKMENLPLKGHPETDGGDEICAKDSTNFLSELHDGNASFSSDFSRVIVSDVESDESCKETEHDESLNFRCDPSEWTPMEIETATGDADCTLVEHSLKLSSTYAEVEDCSGTRDSNGEPLVTSYNRCFLGTVDYIWRSEGLHTVGVLAPIPKHAMQWTRGFPTKKWGSDHIALVSELAFAKDRSIQNS